MIEETYPEIFDKLVPLTGGDYDLSALDEIKIGGRAAVGIKVALQGHRDVLRLFFDKDSGLLVKRENQIMDEAGKLVALEIIYSGHKEADGVKLYRKAVAYVGGKKFEEFTIDEIKFFDRIQDSVFAKP